MILLTKLDWIFLIGIIIGLVVIYLVITNPDNWKDDP